MEISVPDRHASPNIHVVLLVAAIIAAAINGAFFVNVYWLNADDVMFLQFSLEGLDAVIEAAKLYSAAQGRFGQSIQMPINILGAYLSQFVFFRLAFVSLFFLAIWVYLIWFDRALRTNIRAFAFLLCAALTALHFYHLPPTSFPLQNTVPYLALALSRLAIMRARDLDRSLSLLWALPLFSLTMVLSEYAFLFGTGMLAVEYLAVLCRAPHWRTLLGILRSRRLYIDFAACLVPLFLYLGWRTMFPSAYDGNSLDGFADPALALRVWALHAFGLNGLALPQGWVMFNTGWTRLWPPLVAAIVIMAAVFLAIPRHADFNRPLVPAGLALLFALYVTFPASMTLKQQEWCADAGACVFLDSRTAFPAAMVFLLFLGGGLWALLPHKGIARMIVRGAFSLLAAWLTALTVAHNAWMVDHMQTRMAVWHHADSIACTVDPVQSDVRAVVDPQGVIDIHPHMDPDNFWRIYLAHARSRCSGG